MELYHGSFYGGIRELLPVSRFHEDKTQKVVYLTENRAYALFYIWDGAHNQSSTKWITCGVVNGTVSYEEQFPNQLRSFYSGVRGYVYSAEQREPIEKAAGNGMWVSRWAVPIAKTEYIEDVYKEIIRCEKEGLVRVARFRDMTPEEQDQVVEKAVYHIRQRNLLGQPQSEEARFMRRYHAMAWERAKAAI